MFGPKLSTVFASRWRALWFSACILGTAYCSIPGKDEPSAAAADAKAAIAASDLTAEQKDQLGDVMNQLQAAQQ